MHRTEEPLGVEPDVCDTARRAESRLTELVRTGLARLNRLDIDVRVTALGVSDSLSTAVTRPAAEADTAVPVAFYGREAIVGPRPYPGERRAPCPRCLPRRWQSVRTKSLREALELGGPTEAVGMPPYVTPFCVEALIRLVVDCHDLYEPLPDSGPWYALVHRIDLERLTVRAVRLTPDPECPDCGRRRRDSPEGARIELPASPKLAADTFRQRDLDDYDLRFDALANPVCGLLGPALVYESASPTTSATLGCFTLRKGTHLHEVFWGGHANRYDQSARIGVLEGLERYAGMRPRGKTVEVVASLDALGDDALDPRECGLYDDEFYRRDGRVLPFSPTRPIPWVWGYSLRDQRPVLVPEILTYYHTSDLAQRFVQECSNGCASGSSLTEAIYHGLMELVERDAFLLTWYGRAPLPEIDPRTSARHSTREMVERLAMYGYRARFFDARITFPMPVVIAVAQRFDGQLGALCFGAGASLDPEDALSAGLSEIATDAPKSRRRTERDQAELREMAADFDKVLALHDHPRLYGLPEMAGHASFLLGDEPAAHGTARSVAELYDGAVSSPSLDLRDDVQECVAAVVSAGFDVIVVDQTLTEQRELGVHTASVIVPGLIPIDFGWRRQRALLLPRLRTALRAAGIVDHDLEPAEFNRAPHPFP